MGRYDEDRGGGDHAPKEPELERMARGLLRELLAETGVAWKPRDGMVKIKREDFYGLVATLALALAAVKREAAIDRAAGNLEDANVRDRAAVLLYQHAQAVVKAGLLRGVIRLSPGKN